MKKIYLSPPDVGHDERAMLLDAFDSNWIAPLGPHVDAFEREVAQKVGAAHAAALSSGSAALHLALRILGVERGDEIIISSFTFCGSVNPVVHDGAVPVFIDSCSATWNMDPGLLEEELAAAARRGKLPKAAVVVDLYGQCADYDPIVAVCDRYGIPVIEDAAEALGATYRGRPAGTLGSLGLFSFNGNKIITTSGGGMLVSEHKEWIDRARYLATQARDPAPHYQHSQCGFNYRMSNLLAAVGRGQLRNLDQKIARRREINAMYRRALGSVGGIAFMPEATYGRANCWLSCITIDTDVFGASREDVRRRLDERNIESRPVWKPMHLQPVFSGCRTRGGAVSAKLFEEGLCLPSGSSLTNAECEFVIDSLLSARGAHP